MSTVKPRRTGTRHLVDPELLPLLDAVPPLVLTRDNLVEARAASWPMPPMDSSGTVCERRSVAGPKGMPDIVLQIVKPQGATLPLPCIYDIHGGGYVMGRVADFEFLHRQLVRELGCVLISVDYRLAPETSFPGNIEDCYAGLAWTYGHAAELAIDRSRLGVMGASAGGGLAAALALLARDRGEYKLAFQHLIYPMLDDRTCVIDRNPVAGEFVWTRASNAFGWSALLGHAPGVDGVSSYAAAARAQELSGLPPTFMSTATLDLFVDEDIEYAQRLMHAGVATELHVYPGAFHGFDGLGPDTRIGTAARQASVAALRRSLCG